jgi:hypothetical protein
MFSTASVGPCAAHTSGDMTECDTAITECKEFTAVRMRFIPQPERGVHHLMTLVPGALLPATPGVGLALDWLPQMCESIGQ